MKQTVTVIEKKPESYIVGCDKSACQGCHSEMFCKNKNSSFEVQNPDKIEAKKGEEVEIDVPEKKAIISIFLSLGLPLLMFLPGYFLGKRFTGNEVILFVWGVGGIAVGFLFSYFFFKKFKKQFSPIVVGTKDEE